MLAKYKSKYYNKLIEQERTPIKDWQNQTMDSYDNYRNKSF